MKESSREKKLAKLQKKIVSLSKATAKTLLIKTADIQRYQILNTTLTSHNEKRQLKITISLLIDDRRELRQQTPRTSERKSKLKDVNSQIKTLKNLLKQHGPVRRQIKSINKEIKKILKKNLSQL